MINAGIVARRGVAESCRAWCLVDQVVGESRRASCINLDFQKATTQFCPHHKSLLIHPLHTYKSRESVHSSKPISHPIPPSSSLCTPPFPSSLPPGTSNACVLCSHRIQIQIQTHIPNHTYKDLLLSTLYNASPNQSKRMRNSKNQKAESRNLRNLQGR